MCILFNVVFEINGIQKKVMKGYKYFVLYKSVQNHAQRKLKSESLIFTSVIYFLLI